MIKDFFTRWAHKWAIPGGACLVGVFFLFVGAMTLYSCGCALQTGCIRVARRRHASRQVFRDLNPFDFWFYLFCEAGMGIASLTGSVGMFVFASFLWS